MLLTKWMLDVFNLILFILPCFCYLSISLPLSSVRTLMMALLFLLFLFVFGCDNGQFHFNFLFRILCFAVPLLLAPQTPISRCVWPCQWSGKEEQLASQPKTNKYHLHILRNNNHSHNRLQTPTQTHTQGRAEQKGEKKNTFINIQNTDQTKRAF